MVALMVLAGVEILLAVMVPLALLSVPSVRRPRRHRRRRRASAHEIADRPRQLDQLRDPGLLDEAAYKERRTQILAEL